MRRVGWEMRRPPSDDLRVPCKDAKKWTVAVATIVDYVRWLVLPDTLLTKPGDTAVALAGFRDGFYRSLTKRADALFELTDALLCTDGPVKSLVGLSLAPEHRRGTARCTTP
jgi:hypothetical protein